MYSCRLIFLQLNTNKGGCVLQVTFMYLLIKSYEICLFNNFEIQSIPFGVTYVVE